MQPDSAAPFSSPETLGKWTSRLLLAVIVLAMLAAVSEALELEFLSRAAATGDVSEAEAETNDLRQGVIALLQFVTLIATIVAFLRWFYRVHRNLPALGERNLLYTSKWAVWSFFVPFLNLVRPFQIMREVWHGSDPSALNQDGTVEPRNTFETPRLVGWWWGLFIVSNVFDNLAARMMFLGDDSLQHLQTAGAVMLISDILNIPAAILAIRLVVRLAHWQMERAELIRERGPVSPLPAVSPLRGLVT